MLTTDIIDALPMLPMQIVGEVIASARLGNSIMGAFNAQASSVNENRMALADLEEMSFRNNLASQLNKTKERLNYNIAVREARKQQGMTQIAYARMGINTTAGSALNQISYAYQNTLAQILRSTA